jgi:hypothetical protein
MISNSDLTADLYNNPYLPKGIIALWSGTIATIPAGWALCNGLNGTPDLRNRFVVGANADSGGAAKSTITGAALQTGGSVTHSHFLRTDISGIGAGIDAGLDTQPEHHIPPFYALAYIMKL